MRLVGMLDSPYVRRLAITLQMLGIEYEHTSQSVVAGYDTFKTINPLAKAPTLVLDDDELLIESTLIISYLESMAGRSLQPAAADEQRRALQITGVALTAMDKVVARIYETEMRPPEYQYQPWLDRIVEQFNVAFDWLDRACADIDGERWFFGETMTQADISTAVAWRFLQAKAPAMSQQDQRPALAAFGERAEALPEFKACPLD